MPGVSRFTSLPHLICTLCILLALAACGGTGQPSTQPPTATTSPYNGGGYGAGPAVTTPTPTAPTPTTQTSGSGQSVTMFRGADGYAFDPVTLTVPVGTTVTWTNQTATSHTVTSDDGTSFDSSVNTPIASGATYSFKFTKPGHYTYHCSFHVSMKAVIIVQ